MDLSIEPGVILDGKFLLLYQLGKGTFAKVWLVYNIIEKKYFALKVQNASSYNDGKEEVKNLKKIFNLQCPHINKMIGNFTCDSKRGSHVCMIFDLMTGSLFDLLDEGKYKYGFSIEFVKKVTKQILLGLNDMHKAKLIHTDLKPENILLKGTRNEINDIIKCFEDTNFKENLESLNAQFNKNKSSNKNANKKKFKRLKKLTRELAFESVETMYNLYDKEYSKNIADDENSQIDSNSGEFNELDDSAVSDNSKDSKDSKDSKESNDSKNSDGNENENDYSDYSDYSDSCSTCSDSCSSDDGDDSDDDSKHNGKKKLNKRSQSVNDFEEDLLIKEIHDLDKFYDFEIVLNNRENSSEKHYSLVPDDIIDNPFIKISDFGNTTHIANKTKHEIQTRHYRAPEIIIDSDYSFECDIWSVGCIVFELLTGYVLFEPLKNPINKDIHHLYLMEKFFGPLPKKMILNSRRGKILYDANYKLRCVGQIKYLSIKDILVKQHKFSEQSATDIYDFLKIMLKYEPKERATVVQCLEHHWLNQ
jgi:serine/threonine protein kinase